MSQHPQSTHPEVLLAIEAATAAGSVALVRNGELLAECDAAMGASREDSLMPAVATVLSSAGLAMRDVHAIVCGSGPGSFTSLRIAAAVAKGLAEAGRLPLFAISSMWLAALELRETPGEYLLHSDALRGERFAQRFRVADGALVEPLDALQRLPLSDVEASATLSDNAPVLIAVGTKLVSAHDARFVSPRARNVAFAMRHAGALLPVDIASWEPNYGRLAEAQVKWEETHQRALPNS